MRKLTRSLFALLLAFGMLFAFAATASAASTVEQDGLEVSIITDKDVYQDGEEIVVSISIKNTNGYAVSGVSIEMLLPEGLNIKTGALTGDNITIPAGDTYSAEVTAEPAVPVPVPTEPAPTEPAPTEPAPTEPAPTEPAPTEPAPTEPAPTEPAPTEPTPTEPAPTMPAPTEPAPTEPAPTEPAPTEPAPTEPAPTEPAPTMPAPTEPAPTMPAPTEPAPTVPAPTEPKPSEKPTDPDNYETGDPFSILLWIALALASAGGMILVLKFKKGMKAMCLILCAAMLLSIVPAGAFATEEDNTATITVDKTIAVGGEEYTIALTVVYSETDEDTESENEQIVPEEIAELFGVDPNENDSDNDGLSNYVEIYMTGTNPTLADTDGDGVADAEEDADDDGLSNAEEMEKGTDLTKTDSDNDGISDYKEINETYTDPCKYDTDEDGVSDGDELVLGLNPLEEKTDGITLDSERKFTQKVNTENIDEQLTDEENDAIPSLTLTTSGNVNDRVAITTTESNDFSDSRAIVGEPIDVSGDNLGEGTISFALKNSESTFAVRGTRESFNTNLICKYNEDGSTEYLDTTFDADKNTVSAAINGEGTYFVLDVKNLFDELGLALPTVADISTLTDPEPATRRDTAPTHTDNGNANNETVGATVATKSKPVNATTANADAQKSITRTSSGAMAQADIVFLIDTTGSMSDEIYNVKENVEYFVDALKAKGVSAGLALIDYQDLEADGYDSTRVHKNGTSNWFYDMDAYKTAISNLELGWGGDTPECAVDALETGRLLDMRASAGKIFVLVTDADYKIDNRYDIPSMAAEIELLKNAGVTCAVVSPYYEQSTYYDLYTETNGVWANIYGDFYTELMTLADKIGSDIVGDGYWIYLDGPIPVPVRLDEEPKVGSTVDTDMDGIPDIEELEGATPTGSIDLDALITKVSKGAITGTDYGTVMMYKYKSSPVETDTDFDGLSDLTDNTPKSNTFTGELSGHRNIKSATYKIDYRDFLKSNKNYNSNIASASLVFANTIYSGASFKYSDTGMVVSDIEGLLDFHGFDKTDTFELKSRYSDDDVSEIGYGYRDVEYNGKVSRIIAVVVRGTNGTTAEWSSNFDLGNPSDWNSDYHKGFYVTEERIREYLGNYVSNLDSSDITDIVYWVTGHSRGAAIANILASKLIDTGNQVFAYTFATPSTTVSTTWNNTKYNSIFNFANTSDVVAYVPLQQWNFNRFGITYPVSIEDASLEGVWREQTGRLEYNALNKSLITLALNRIYKSCSKSWAEVYENSGKQKIDDTQYSYISSRAKKYCRLERDYTILGNEDGYYLYPSTAFVLQLAAEMIADETSENQKANNIKLLKELWNTKYGGAILLLLGDVITNLDKLPNNYTADLLFDTHAAATYYVLIP